MPRVPVSRVNIDSFLELLEQKNLSGSQVVAFSARGYPISFYQHVVRSIGALQGLTVSVFSGDDVEELMRLLSISFLGSAFVYFIPDISIFSSQARKKLETFFVDYQGCHTIVLASSEGSFEPSYATINALFEDRLDAQQANRFAKIFFGNRDESSFSESVLLEDFVALSLVRLVSAGIEKKDFDFYVARITANEGSVFSLAQFWLGKNIKEFGSLWRIMHDVYPVEYWVSFFSDLLWQAAYCVERRGQGLERALTNRLPFSFTKRDWRTYTLRELAAAHAKLYELDWQTKHGGSAQQLDFFITKFVCGQFGSSSR